MLTRTARGLLIGAAMLYCIAIVTLVALWAIGPERVWWLALSNVFALYLFAPLPFLALAALLLRSRWLHSAVLLVLAAFLALFGPQLIPPLGQASDGPRLRVMTINQLYTNERIADL